METPNNPRGDRWSGAVEVVSLAVITGWAVDMEDLDGCVELEVRASSGGAALIIADRSRHDLRDAGFGNGNHGFRMDIGGQFMPGESISIRFATSGADLPGTPIQLPGEAEPAADRWRSNVESVSEEHITGWACDMHDPDHWVELEVWTSTGRQGSVLADIYREDLRDAGLGDGRHGFIIDLGKFEPHDSAVSINFAASGAAVTLKPIERVSAKPRAEIGRWRSNIDSIASGSIAGWACDMGFPDESVEIEAYAKSGWNQTVIAGRYREDLRDAGIGNGCHAFEIDLSSYEGSDGAVALRFAKSGVPIASGQREIFPREAILHSRFPSRFCSLMEVLAWEARRGFETPATVIEETQRGSNDPSHKLFATFDASRDPEGLVTQFLQSENSRLQTKGGNVQARGLQDRLEALIWYLSDYHQIRNCEHMIPISRRQILYLNQPVPIAGYPALVTVALYNFIVREREDLLALSDPVVLREAIYWWCVDKAPKMNVERCLVTREQIDFLRQEEQWVGDEFSLNRFAARYIDENQDLHFLDVSKSTHRQAYFLYLVVLSYKSPHLARLLPRDAVRRIIYGNESQVAAFDRAMAHLAFSQRENGGDAADLRAKGDAFLKTWGYDLRNDSLVVADRDLGECLMVGRSAGADVEAGVCVIGPIHKASGLGQAARASHKVLSEIESTPPTVLPFDLDNPAPSEKSARSEVAYYDGCRAINLIHLNAEAIPSGFAFSQNDVFSKSYNIGFFFWELNVIPECQFLALDLLDEIWVASEYVRETYARYTKKPVVNVGMAAPPLLSSSGTGRAELGLPADATIFLTTFDSFSFIERKNPLAVIAAFKQAFPDPAERVHLVLKTQNRRQIHDPYQVSVWARVDQAVDADQRITLINETFSYEDLLALKANCDCYVSLHRAEGWGFGMIEAMQLARPVIATRFSGNMDFCTHETAYLVDYDLVAVRQAEYLFAERGSVWADPKTEQAAAQMRAVHADPVSAKIVGAKAAAHVAENFSTEAIGRRYAARLAAIRNLVRARAAVHQ